MEVRIALDDAFDGKELAIGIAVKDSVAVHEINTLYICVGKNLTVMRKYLKLTNVCVEPVDYDLDCANIDLVV